MPLPEGQRVEVLAEFSADQAGELVSWSHFEIDERDVVFGSIAYARISADGARYTQIVDSDKAIFTQSDSITGFDRTVELGFNALSADRGLAAEVYLSDIRGPTLAPPGYQAEAYNNIPFGSRLLHQPEAGKGVWTVGEDLILEKIKEQMSAQDIAWLYSIVYYNLAYLADESDILADPEMAMETAEVAANTRQYAADLHAVQTEDQAMALDLTVFGNVQPKNIPIRFTESRQKVAEVERGLLLKRKSSAINSWQLPIGYSPSGRSWPYMDPTEADEHKAFGAELSDLRRQDTTRATNELDKEIAEIGPRIERANEISRRVGILVTKEIEKARVNKT